MTKLTTSALALLIAILLSIVGWWVTEVNASMKVTQQLQFRSLYLNGDVPNAPVAQIGQKP